MPPPPAIPAARLPSALLYIGFIVCSLYDEPQSVYAVYDWCVEVYTNEDVRGVVFDDASVDQPVNPGFSGGEAGGDILGGATVLVQRVDGDVQPLVGGDTGLEGAPAELFTPPFSVGRPFAPVVRFPLLIEGGGTFADDF